MSPAESRGAGPLPCDKTIEYVRSITEAIDYVHRRGVIHRDLKPAGVRCVAFSSDGEKILGGDSSGWITFWEADTGEVLHTLMGHAGAVSDIALSPDGTRLVSCSSDHSIRVWKLPETISRTK